MLYNAVYIVRSHFKIILVPGVLTADTGLSLSPPAANIGHWPLALGVNISIEDGDIMSSESKY